MAKPIPLDAKRQRRTTTPRISKVKAPKTTAPAAPALTDDEAAMVARGEQIAAENLDYHALQRVTAALEARGLHIQFEALSAAAERQVLRDLITEGIITEEQVAARIYAMMRRRLEARLQQEEQASLDQARPEPKGQAPTGNRAVRRAIAKLDDHRRTPGGIILPGGAS